jgi:hypothetical protein
MIMRLKFEPRDVWVGVYWTRTLLPSLFSNDPEMDVDVWDWCVYICLVPCVVFQIAWERPAR